MKKRLLIFPFDLLSHYLRCITLAKNYSDHEVLFAASFKYNDFVERAGYSTFTVEQFDPARVMEEAARFSFDWLNENDIERVYLSQLKVIQELKPDLVLGDTAPSLKMAAEAGGVKYVALMNGYMTRYYAGIRNVSITHYSYPYLQQLPPWLADRITVLAERFAFRQVHAPFRKLRSNYGLRRLRSYLDELEGDENLICDQPDLFPQKQLPSNYRIIGPLLYRSQQDETAFIHSLDPEKPTVCICLGSSGNWKALSFLSGEAYHHINFIAAGDSQRILTGPHIFSKEFINLDQVLPHCAFMICHGGNGTIYEGLKHHTYMLCLTHHFEQEWNVRRLQELKLGESINFNPDGLIHAKLSSLKERVELGVA